MRKLIVVIVGALIAGLASAATVNWGNYKDARIQGVDGENISAANAKAWGLQAVLVNTTTGEELTSYGSTTTSAIGKTAGVLGVPAYNYTYGNEAKNGDVLTVILKMTVDGNAYTLDTGLTYTITATDDGGSDGMNTAAVWGTTPMGGASGWSSVPEPTSALLLLVGGALLGLRRRRV